MTEREQLPRILGYGHLEAGVATSGMEGPPLLTFWRRRRRSLDRLLGATPCFRCTLRSPWSVLLLTGTVTVALQTMMAIRWPVYRPTSLLRCIL